MIHQLPPRHNHGASAVPLVTDDSTAGYSKGSLWLYDGVVYVCADAAAGAAVWAGVGQTNLANNLFFVDYNDTSSAASPVTLVADTWTTLPNDGLGAFTNTTFLPSGVSLLGAGGAIDISDLALGSDVSIRPDFTVTPTSNNSSISFRFSLGTGAGAYTLETNLGRLDLGAGIPYRFSLLTLYVYAGDTNTRDNPVALEIKLSGGGTVVNAGMALQVRSL